MLIAAALIAVYIVLGVLYESYIHPITILSTLPSAGVGAVLALLVFHTEFSIIALIGVILLIGIVKKNAIMMIDFALDAERTRDMDPRDAIFEACRLRFRPIMMTTSAAMLGALPLALSFGDGGELRRPLGISIVGGLMVSQVLTLYTTPVLYLYLDRFRLCGRTAVAAGVPWSVAPARGRRNEVGYTVTPLPASSPRDASSCRAMRLPRESGDPRSMRQRSRENDASRRVTKRPNFVPLLLGLTLSACMVGPDYHRPDAPVPVAYQGTGRLDNRAAAGRVRSRAHGGRSTTIPSWTGWSVRSTSPTRR